MGPPSYLRVVYLCLSRSCLWILGNEKALVVADVWQDILYDVKKKNCFFNAEEDKELAQVIINVKCELNELDDLFDKESTIFRAARWKVRTFSIC